MPLDNNSCYGLLKQDSSSQVTSGIVHESILLDGCGLQSELNQANLCFKLKFESITH